VAVPGAVVVERLALHRVLDCGDVNFAVGPLNRPLQGRESDAGVAAAAPRQHRQRLVADRRRARDPALGVGQCSPQQLFHLARLEWPQLIHLRPREQGRVDLEVGVLRRRPDQRQQPFLDRRQQRVLLGLVEAVNLVEEENRRPAAPPPPLPRPLDHRPDLGFPRVHRRLLLKRPLRPSRRDPRQRRLPRPRRPIEDRAVGLAAFHRPPQRRPLTKHMLLPDHLLERPRPHADGEWSVDRRLPRLRASVVAAIEKLVGH
jgi:hypothetical protein